MAPGDIIKNNEDGYLIENNNIEEFSETLIKLIEDKELRLRMGLKAKENVKRYSSYEIASQWNTLFNKVI
ncbi:glycosyltransferase [Tenacibaculum retecalamus]|uniref:glycosyltransferase n=1 Tax=Tenacibaculum retecalamus TaxID=3018315 RepID=UPI0023D95C15|nr:glycosyltransferase [Tenacibaculum retecalamus]WBX70734.1 glycosyltransferase [Tenacibaculum retecalamus]